MFTFSWKFSSAGRASALQAEGHRFEPCNFHLLSLDGNHLSGKLGKMGGFPSGQREQTVNLLALPSVVRIHFRPLKQIRHWLICFQARNAHTAGWSSLEARRAHNPKVIGSNPVPAILKSTI